MSASSLPLPEGKSDSLKQFISRHINVIGLLVVIAILYLVFAINAPGFISLNNQMNVLRDAATIGIAAWAMTLIIISGAFGTHGARRSRKLRSATCSLALINYKFTFLARCQRIRLDVHGT
jgi:ABC-type glucose/galactose transport system permease subunit